MNDEEREHLTLRFYRPELGFVVRRFEPPPSWPAVTRAYLVDTPADYEKARALVSGFEHRRFPVQALLELSDS
jgi:spore coat polysaccharide biosynthesis protein SpsF (cytidylyltransferase family)